MELKIRYITDRRCRRLTVLYILLLAAAIAAIFIFAEKGYMQAWLFSLVGAILILYILSVPRQVKVNDRNLEIHCIVEMTRIEIRDIASISIAGPESFKRLRILLGSYGFFGYYGYYLQLRGWDIVKVYMTERSNLIEIEDIYEQKYLISCSEPQELIDFVLERQRECLREKSEVLTQ